MQDQEVTRAAEAIWQLWQKGGVVDELPHAIRPTTRRAGYAIQAEFERLGGAPTVGWKIAATSLAGQKHIGVGGPLAGRIFASRTFPDGAHVSLAGNRMRVAEPEFAFRFGNPLHPRSSVYETREVMAAVASLHLAIELPDSRFVDFAKVGEPTLIADDACAHMLVLGNAIDGDWRAIDLSQHRVRARVAERYERNGIGANVLGDPRAALTWIANELSGLGIGLKPGQFVTTGTCMVPLEIEPGDEIRADFGSLGTIILTCNSKAT